MVTLAKPTFAFDKMHHKSSDAGVNKPTPETY
jgi:hypothetical protein